MTRAHFLELNSLVLDYQSSIFTDLIPRALDLLHLERFLHPVPPPLHSPLFLQLSMRAALFMSLRHEHTLMRYQTTAGSV